GAVAGARLRRDVRRSLLPRAVRRRPVRRLPLRSAGQPPVAYRSRRADLRDGRMAVAPDSVLLGRPRRGAARGRVSGRRAGLVALGGSGRWAQLLAGLRLL